MPGHQHLGGAHMTQNQGNTLGDRPCVKQSRLYRQHCGGNAMKDIMGQDGLKWDHDHTEGAYAGRKVHDPLADKPKNTELTGKIGSGASAVEQQGDRKVFQRRCDKPEVTGKVGMAPEMAEAPMYSQDAPQQQKGHRPGAGMANRQTYNFMTGQ